MSGICCALQGLSRLLRQEQSSALDRRPRCGLILQPTTLLKSRRKWLKTYKSNVPTSTEAAINNRAEQPARDPAAAAESDYSSAFIPKGMFAEDLHHFLAHNCRKTQWSGIPSKLVGAVQKFDLRGGHSRICFFISHSLLSS